MPTPIPRSPVSATSQAFSTKKALNTTTALHPATFPHWLGLSGSTQTLRLLPNLQNHPAPFVEKRVIKLPFDGGIIGGTGEPVQVTFVCPETFGLICPVTEGIRSWWRDEDTKDEARRRYRIPSFWFNGVNVATTIQETEPPTNPIRLYSFSKPLYENSVRPAFLDPDFEYSPVDPVEGRDFHVRKTQNGAWPSYASSAFAYKPRPLNDAELGLIETHGLWDIGAAILGTPPTSEDIDLMAAMFEDSVNGTPFDPNKYPTYRAFPISGPNGVGAVAPTPPAPNGNRGARIAKLRTGAGASPAVDAETAATMVELRSRNSSVTIGK